MKFSTDTFRELAKDIFAKMGKQRFYIMGSFSLALLEHELTNIHTIHFNDIDVLCTTHLQQDCMSIHDYFKDKYDINVSFNFYSSQYTYAEEVIQESSLFNIHRILVDVKNKQIWYDKNTFNNPEDLLTAYFNRDIKFNEDCCIYYYRKLDENLKQFEKYHIPVTEEIIQCLEKKLRYTWDEKYILDFYNSETRYSRTPKDISFEKPKVYHMVYYKVKNKFRKDIIDVQSV